MATHSDQDVKESDTQLKQIETVALDQKQIGGSSTQQADQTKKSSLDPISEVADLETLRQVHEAQEEAKQMKLKYNEICAERDLVRKELAECRDRLERTKSVVHRLLSASRNEKARLALLLVNDEVVRESTK
jgi:hypothetical protein